MGTGYVCKCNKCGFSIEANLGVGFMFPRVYQTAVERMKSGEYGEQGKKFFKEHPDGAISCETVVAKCLSCGDCGPVPDFTMYVPKPDYNPEKAEHEDDYSVFPSLREEEYVSWLDLEEHYDEYEKFDHRCPECGGKAEIIPDFEKQLEEGTLGCPKCDGLMEIEDIIKWD